MGFSLPAVTTCLGATQTCLAECFGRRGRFLTRAVQGKLAENLLAASQPDFAARMIAEVRQRCPRGPVRVHPVGDFATVEYIEAWCRIARMTPRCRYWWYSRAWRVEELRPALIDLGCEPNVRPWWSLDRDAPDPGQVPPGVSLAYLQTTADENIPDADLVFRPRRLRRDRPRTFALGLICNSERPQPTAGSCAECGRCFDEGPGE